MKAFAPVPRDWDGVPRRRARPARLPQQPHKQNIRAMSSPFATVGKRITGVASPKVTVHHADSEVLLAARSTENALQSGCYYDKTPYTASDVQKSFVDTHGVDFGGGQNAKESPHSSSMPGDALDLAQGGDALLKRLAADMNSANLELKKLRARLEDREAQLQTELNECRKNTRFEREKLLEQLRQCNKELGQRQGERDEAKVQKAELETKLREALAAPDIQEARVRAMEMEMSLMRLRFAKEKAAREKAEQALKESMAKQQQFQVRLSKSTCIVQQFQQALAEQKELMAFRQEVCDDLQTQLERQKADSEHRFRLAKGKFEAIMRLESVLPQQVLLKALD